MGSAIGLALCACGGDPFQLRDETGDASSAGGVDSGPTNVGSGASGATGGEGGAARGGSGGMSAGGAGSVGGAGGLGGSAGAGGVAGSGGSGGSQDGGVDAAPPSCATVTCAFGSVCNPASGHCAACADVPGCQLLDHDPTLLGYWKLDEPDGQTVRDSGPLGLHGALTGALRTPGVFGGALEFDEGTGADADYVDCGAVLGTLSLPLTFSAWVAPEAPGTTRILLATHYDPGAYHGAWIGLSNQDELYTGFGRGGTSALDPIMGYSRSDTVPTGSWRHVAATLAGPREMALFINGQPVPVSYINASTGTLSASAGRLSFGRTARSDGPSLVGKLDDVRLYGRVLTNAEIARLSARD